ncbi:uncharacterized protein LOC6579160 isoform X21 [Drosophila mojavensis]|uniref:Uncharacterized protein, isoform U n=1 Tax=Drosophila mojavensis TaxID=7230 RepID=A0A0Q9XJB2_DROMO|nr:uncharacterized protein LOC6579160 isoform X21 [Drosophila mojavensis]KRG04407.1 uncharacterized protein Dmoj_GI20257, isoform U [Drosophila mojavensis]
MNDIFTFYFFLFFIMVVVLPTIYVCIQIARTLWSLDVSTVVTVIFFTLNQTARRPHAYRSSWRRMRRICPAMKRSCVCAI